MLVAEHGDRPSRCRDHSCNLLEEVLPRIQVLPLFVPGIVPVLPDQQHPVHRQFAPAQRKRLRDAGIDRHIVYLRDLHPDILLVNLI